MPPLGFLLTEAKSLTLSALPLLKKLPQQASTRRNMQGERWSEWSWTSWRSSQDNPDFFSFQLFHSATKTWSIHAIHIHDSDLSDAELKDPPLLECPMVAISPIAISPFQNFLFQVPISTDSEATHVRIRIHGFPQSIAFGSMEPVRGAALALELMSLITVSLFQRFSQLNTKTNQKSSISWCVFSVILIWIKGFCLPTFPKSHVWNTCHMRRVHTGYLRWTPALAPLSQIWELPSVVSWSSILKAEKKLSKQIENRKT